MKITDYLAIYAAFLSTLVFLWNLRQARPRLKANIVAGFKKNETGSEFGAFIIVRNLSSHEVHLAAISLLYQHGKPSLKETLTHLLKYRHISKTLGWVHSSLSHYDVEDECPVSLGARKAHRVFIPQTILDRIGSESGERILMCNVQDQLWNNVLSNKFTWNKPPES